MLIGSPLKACGDDNFEGWGLSSYHRIKSVEKVLLVHKKHILTYLKLTGIKLGLLINFNENLLKDGITRVVNNL